MSRYTLITGWLMCDQDELTAVNNYCNAHMERHGEYHMEYDSAFLYIGAICIPKIVVNGIPIISYGCNIRSNYISFIRDLFIGLNSIIIDMEGEFYVLEEDKEDQRTIWKFREGKFEIILDKNYSI